MFIHKHVSSQLARATYTFVSNEHSKESEFFLMFRRNAHMPLMQLLNWKIRYIDDNESLLPLDALGHIYALAIHIIKLSQERKASQFPTYPIPKFHVGGKVLARNHTRDVWDPQYDVAYCMVCVMGWQLELVDKGGKVCKFNFQGINITFLVGELTNIYPMKLLLDVLPSIGIIQN